MPRRQPKPWDYIEDAGGPLELEKVVDSWELRERFPRKPGQRHVEVPQERPLGLRYGEDGEPLGEQLGSRVVALFASHIGSPSKLAALERCLRSVEAQIVQPVRFVLSTSADAGLADAVAVLAQGSPCVDEHLAHSPQGLPRFEHYRRLRDVVREREQRLEDVWVFFSDDDAIWHPYRCGAITAAVERVRRRVQRHVQAVCSCIHVRPRQGGRTINCAADVSEALADMVNGSRDYGSESAHLCVRFSAFSAFFEEHCANVVRHALADVRFCQYVRHYGKIPARAHAGGGTVIAEAILEPGSTAGSVEEFLPEKQEGPPNYNWMYFYDKVRDEAVHSAALDASVQVIHPDDGWYLSDLAGMCSDGAKPEPDDCLLAACAALRQRVDFELFRLPRQRLVALAVEVADLAASAADSQPGRALAYTYGAAAVAAWARSLAFLRCKALKVEVRSPDFCAACGKAAQLRCSQCRAESYCGEDCQWTQWQRGHRLRCAGRSCACTGDAACLKGKGGVSGAVAPLPHADLVFDSVD